MTDRERRASEVKDLDVTVPPSGAPLPPDKLEAMPRQAAAADAGELLHAMSEAARRGLATVRATGGAPMTAVVDATATAGYEPEPYQPDADETVQCPSCDKMNAPDARFCDQCGFKLEGSDRVDATDETEDLGGKPSKGTPADKRLKANRDRNKSTPNSVAETAAADAPTEPAVMQVAPMWRGPLVVEGEETGDGREFATDSITWADPPLPLRWQYEDSHGGTPMNKTASVGTIQRVWRDGNLIMGEGIFDLGGPSDDLAHEAYRRNQDGALTGISIDADDITDADVEYIFKEPEGEEDEDNVIMLLFGSPEKIVFHTGRIRAATLCDIPAFVEAKIDPIPEADRPAALVASAQAIQDTFSAVSPHSTATSDGSWDGPANEKRLPSPMPAATARAAYAWLDTAEVTDGECPKTAGRFLHHEVSADGAPGAANLTACSTGIGVLNGGRGGTTIPAADKQGVYNHLAKHLRDAGNEPPELQTSLEDTLTASTWQDQLWRPPAEWFDDPKLGQYVPIMVTEAGRVYGHAAAWGQCHLGFTDECVMPPFEADHSHFMTGEIPLADGKRAAVGQITAGIEHAGLHLSASQAKDHYENTDACVADVVVGNDAHGIWVAGAIRPWAHAARVHALRASGQVSPDWRRIGGALRMVALLTVNTSGYQAPRSRALVAGGQVQALIASGIAPIRPNPDGAPSDEEIKRRALLLLRQEAYAKVHGQGGN